MIKYRHSRYGCANSHTQITSESEPMPYPIVPRPIFIPIGPSIAYVPLTREQWALIDREDAETVGRYNWQAYPHHAGEFYAIRMIRRNRKSITLPLHRFLMGSAPEGMQIDHANGRPLDNRSSNLRFATGSQNACNRKKPAHNTSGLKGVHWHSRDKVWTASIQIDGTLRHLGRFDSPEMASRAYMAAATEIHGEFVRTA